MIFGEARVLHDDSGWNHLREQSRFEALAPTLELCQQTVDTLAANSEMYYGEPAAAASITASGAIGSWRSNRFDDVDDFSIGDFTPVYALPAAYLRRLADPPQGWT